MIMNPEHYVFGRIPKKLKKHKLTYCKLKTKVIKIETEISNCYSEIHDFYKEVLLPKLIATSKKIKRKGNVRKIT